MYAPLLHPASGMWVVGRIENHQAVPLSQGEVVSACKRLNAPAPGDLTGNPAPERLIPSSEWTVMAESIFTDAQRNAFMVATGMAIDIVKDLCRDESRAGIIAALYTMKMPKH